MDSSAQYFLRHGCYVCYRRVLKCVGVVIILTMYAPLTVGSSLCLCSCVVDQSVYVEIIRMLKYNTIKWILKEYSEYIENGVIWLRMEQIVSSCEHGNEHLGSININFLSSQVTIYFSRTLLHTLV
jgi:hypothetical protein